MGLGGSHCGRPVAPSTATGLIAVPVPSPDDVPVIEDWNRLLDGRVAVVTGGGSGIGAAIAVLFAQHGALVELADLDGDRVEEVASGITSTGGAARTHVADVTTDDDVARLAESVLGQGPQRHAAGLRAAALVAVATGLADLHVLVLGVGEAADGRPALAADHAHL